MKRFLRKVLLYALITLLIVVLVETFNFYTQQHKMSGLGAEIYQALANSKTPKKAKKLILGDSVGNQLYPPNKEYDSIVSLACSQAVTLAGHYFMLNNYFETNAEDLPEEVIIIMTPFSLCNNVDQYAYHHFLKPFPHYEYSELYTEYLSQRIHTIPLYWSANLPIIRTSSYTPQWAVPTEPGFTKSMSPLSHEYLLKIDSIAQSHNIPLRMVSPPIRDDKKGEIKGFWANLSPDYASDLKSLLQPYKESITFHPSVDYTDRVHFIREKIPADYLGICGNTTDATRQ